MINALGKNYLSVYNLIEDLQSLIPSLGRLELVDETDQSLTIKAEKNDIKLTVTNLNEGQKKSLTNWIKSIV
jgi:hypothetical protein